MYLDDIVVSSADDEAPFAMISAPTVPTIASGVVRYTVSFSEPVIGFTLEDIQVDKTGTVGSGNATMSGTGPYTVTIPYVTGTGTVGITIKPASVLDAAGNTNAAVVSTKCIVLSADGSIADAKTAAEDSTVTMGNKILYYKNGTVRCV